MPSTESAPKLGVSSTISVPGRATTRAASAMERVIERVVFTLTARIFTALHSSRMSLCPGLHHYRPLTSEFGPLRCLYYTSRALRWQPPEAVVFKIVETGRGGAGRSAPPALGVDGPHPDGRGPLRARRDARRGARARRDGAA